ncbi:DUF1801 domain-containing protein [Kangiella sp. HZ709]|uniref:DUF1801 domain-containing protein n=1 Tax=Kangiella sp. HZ709 TaxID=2666328 RepID=UPI0012B025DE|nr:DUF1801 domain-containing protein [Kangiella sp. HZ709]MRX26707.1 DUF1801 domain-containing protein [Kangiella sp. HZ709]
MATANKTQPNNGDVKAFLNAVEHKKRREDSFIMLEMMTEITGEKPVMWGDSIIGFGQFTYNYKSGRSGEWFYTGFSPRKQNLTLYIMDGFKKRPELLDKIGKCKTSVACLYINKLEDVDEDILRQVIKESAEYVKEQQSAC